MGRIQQIWQKIQKGCDRLGRLDRRKFGSQTSDNMQMGKHRWEESERRSQEARRSEKRRSGKQEDQEDAGARKGRKVAIHYVFQ